MRRAKKPEPGGGRMVGRQRPISIVLLNEFIHVERNREAKKYRKRTEKSHCSFTPAIRRLIFPLISLLQT